MRENADTNLLVSQIQLVSLFSFGRFLGYSSRPFRTTLALADGNIFVLHGLRKEGVNTMPRKELIDIGGEVTAETELAYRFFDGKITVWLPKSQCEWDPEANEMTMMEYLAKEKGLI